MLFRGKMHDDWFNRIDILLDGSMEKKWDTVIPADLQQLFVKGDIIRPDSHETVNLPKSLFYAGG
jgi:hypothetical protein